MQYRQRNGNFTTWEDLKKVSELDSKKIEAKRDQLGCMKIMLRYF